MESLSPGIPLAPTSVREIAPDFPAFVVEINLMFLIRLFII